jgi:hypothetical protein
MKIRPETALSVMLETAFEAFGGGVFAFTDIMYIWDMRGHSVKLFYKMIIIT